MKKIVSIILVCLVTLTCVPFQASAAYTTPKDVYIEDAQERLEILADTLSGKFFTVNQKTCGYGLSGHGCDNCRMSYICNSDWIENSGLIVPDSINCVTSQYYPNESKGNPDGWSCYGFANYAHWFVFSQKSSDYLTATLVGTGTLTYKTLKALGACPGDVIRTKYSGSNAKSGHSFILVSYDESGMTILDCNAYPSAPDRANCYVLKRRMAYDSKEIAITGVSNYTRTYSHTHTFNDVDVCTSCADVIDYSQSASKYNYTDVSATNAITYGIASNAAIRVSPYSTNSEGKLTYNGGGFTVLAFLENSQGTKWYEILYNGNKMYVASEDVYTEMEPSALMISPSDTVLTINQGSICKVTGTITSNYTITRVTGTLDGTVYSDFVPNSTSVNIGSTAANQLNSFKGAELSAGTHYLIITATDVSGATLSKTLTINVIGEGSTVTYDANGGYGAPDAQTKVKDVDIALSTIVPTRNGYKFLGWSTSADASVAQYGAGDLYSDNSDVTLYAVWELQSYKNSITLWLTGLKNGEGDNATGDALYLGKAYFEKYYNEEFVLHYEECPFLIPTGFVLRDTWGSGYFASGKNFVMSLDAVTQPAYEIYAEYYCDPVNYGIIYELDGGINAQNNPSTYDVLYGVSFSEPTKDGYNFLGWYDSYGNPITGINNEPIEWNSAEELFDVLSARITGDITVYAKWESKCNILDVSHKISDGKIIFTVVTKAGDFNRIKVTTADKLGGSLGVANAYTINADGNYVWTVKAAEPSENTTYAFDLRSSETGKYLKEYFYAEVEAATPTIISASHSISDGKIIFTVVTKAGDFNRIKVTTADNLGGSLGVANTYTINADGNYVWTVKAVAPTETTNYAFDLRSGQTGKYVKDYGYYECVMDKTIKSVSCQDSGDSLTFTVTTKSGNYNRLRCGLSESVIDNIKNVNSYTVDSNGDYIWTIKITKPTETTSLYFDLRSSETGKFIKEYYIFTYTV